MTCHHTSQECQAMGCEPCPELRASEVVAWAFLTIVGAFAVAAISGFIAGVLVGWPLVQRWLA